MRIAFVTAEYPPQPGGVGAYTHRLACALAARGHEVVVVTGGEEQASEGRGDMVSAVSPLRGISSWGWQCWRDTIAALHRLRPHVLHIQYQTGAYAMHPAINLLPWRLRGLPGSPPCVVTFHDVLEPYLFPKAGYLRRWVTLRLARDARRVIVTNDADAASLHPPAPAVIPIGSNIPVAPPPGYQREEWRARLGVQRGDMLVAYFGLLSRSKGVDVLLQAIHHLHLCQHKPGTRFRLLIIGGTATAPQDRAYAAEVMQQLERLHLREHTIITGHVDEATVSAHLLAADCVALPFRTGASFRSGSLLAALSHGAAVVTTHPPYPIHSETLPSLLHGQHALLVPPEDMGALAEALQRLASDASLQGRLGTEAQNIGARFEWDAIARMHEEESRRGGGGRGDCAPPHPSQGNRSQRVTVHPLTRRDGSWLIAMSSNSYTP